MEHSGRPALFWPVRGMIHSKSMANIDSVYCNSVKSSTFERELSQNTEMENGLCAGA